MKTRHSLYWVPNALTLGRILTIPVLIYGILILSSQETKDLNWSIIVAVLFFLAMATDFLDGFLARRWNIVTDFGRMIDPIADKLLVAGCLIAFSIAVGGQWMILVPAVAIIFRDILVSGAREHAALAGRAMPPTKLAKWKTAFEMFAIATLIYWLIKGGVVLHLGQALLWLGAILSVYTGSLYLRASIKD